jgi:hypothetical protein
VLRRANEMITGVTDQLRLSLEAPAEESPEDA